MSRQISRVIRELDQRDLLRDAERLALAHHVTLEELIQPRRDKTACEARNSLWRELRAREWAQWSISAIARLFGVDRATVSYALGGRPRDRRAA